MKTTIEILLVEDDEHDIELTLRALEENHIASSITVLRNGDEALRFLAERVQGGDLSKMPRLILLDLKLPKCDGHQVLQRIKESPLTKVIPVVVLTSSREEEDMMRSYLGGANSYIQKPVDFEQFRRVVKDLGLYWLVVNQVPQGTAPWTRR